ncbi:uncharacterized protein TRAVEDRAFT_60044 [Trametes versicolor FP-101664 SS1]|uniref:uncharacterized protein n=1 Tax=Trametes versicolor (strain FP-101664) TaxID=717944 RepID=UPI0004621ECC|nr:uncharacterized protein TRAVEDRAFT_60044 [Trametes versicolor FP-101664 SS1]EIW55903.1 hypothetical protein TRAVEDRAFT_60044 [Trametes versicolor FP-101664 SS1]
MFIASRITCLPRQVQVLYPLGISCPFARTPPPEIRCSRRRIPEEGPRRLRRSDKYFCRICLLAERPFVFESRMQRLNPIPKANRSRLLHTLNGPGTSICARIAPWCDITARTSAILSLDM